MQEQLISFKTAKLAKEKGFNWKTFWFYTIEKLYEYDTIEELFECEIKFSSDHFDGSASAPTQSILQKWLREIHNIHIEIKEVINNQWTYNLRSKNIFCNNNYKSYEDALESGLFNALELI